MANMTYEELLGNSRRQLMKGRKLLNQWMERFQQDPVNAMQWESGAQQGAALVHVHTAVQGELERMEQSGKTPDQAAVYLYMRATEHTLRGVGRPQTEMQMAQSLAWANVCEEYSFEFFASR